MSGKERVISGRGRISASARKQSVDKYLRAFAGADDAVLQASACADGPDPGAAYAAVSCAAARMYAMGGQAESAGVHIVLPAEADTGMLSKLSLGAQKACEDAGIYGVSPEVCILEGSFLPRVTVFASGKKRTDCSGTPAQITAGESLIMAGYAGWRGGVLLSKLHSDALSAHFSPSFLRSVTEAPDSSFSPLMAVQAADAAGADAVYVCGEGGIFTGIREFAEQAGLGVNVQLMQILLRQETVEICDFTGVTPYLLMSHGCVLIAARQPLKVQMQLAGAGIPAAMIGCFTDGNDRVVSDGEETRYLEPFRKDSFYDRCI